MGRLAGKIALITGGNSGIGLASARRFVDEGAYVFIMGRRQVELENAVAAIGKNVRAIKGDVSNLDDLDRTIATIEAEKGRLDVVFANAGIAEFAPLGAITKEQYDKIFGVNVAGTLFTVQKALPLMRSGGSIIITGSTTGSKGTPAFSVYSATKAAVRNFARSWALDLRGTGIRVNVLSPGATVTPGLDGVAVATGAPPELFFNALQAQTALDRLAEPSETAAVALFLASDDSSFMTGSEVFVDGGAAQI
jgi:NAD(P)-dependent dehydrogenase (short-subunit alcohol dehydrogenase family)